MKTWTFYLLMFATALQAQKIEFNVSVSSDTLLLGNYLEVRFDINNGKGTFMAPDFAGWNIVSGPNTSSSFSIMNGEMRQSSSYSYYLEAQHEGMYTIAPARLKTEDGEMKTPEIFITVLSNPEGIRQRPKNKEESKFFMEERPAQSPTKTKRKPTKI